MNKMRHAMRKCGQMMRFVCMAMQFVIVS